MEFLVGDIGESCVIIFFEVVEFGSSIQSGVVKIIKEKKKFRKSSCLHKISIFTLDALPLFSLYYNPSVLGACSSVVERQIVDLV
ncbi:MAG: hypothetical protein ACTTKL_01090, partial [Treponema sp.]